MIDRHGKRKIDHLKTRESQPCMDVEFKGIVYSILDPLVKIPGGELEKFFVPILNPAKGDCGIDVRHLSNLCRNDQRDVKTLANEKGRTAFPHQYVEQIFQYFSIVQGQTGADFQRRTRSAPSGHAEIPGFREIKGVKEFCPIAHLETPFFCSCMQGSCLEPILANVSKISGKKNRCSKPSNGCELRSDIYPEEEG